MGHYYSPWGGKDFVVHSANLPDLMDDKPTLATPEETWLTVLCRVDRTSSWPIPQHIPTPLPFLPCSPLLPSPSIVLSAGQEQRSQAWDVTEVCHYVTSSWLSSLMAPVSNASLQPLTSLRSSVGRSATSCETRALITRGTSKRTS